MKHRPEQFSLSELTSLILAGRLAVPEFQRPFVWNPTQVSELLDSIANGWPIGSFLMLQGPQKFKSKDLDGGPAVSDGAIDYYLLDGQQRATSVFHALTGSGKFLYYIDLSKGDFEALPDFRWATKKRGVPQGPLTISLPDLLDDIRFDDAISTLTTSERRRAQKIRDQRLGFLRSADYRIPATVMDQDISLEAMTRIFETLNRTGVRLDAFDLMVAMLYPDGLNLAAMWRVARDEHPEFSDFGAKGIEILKTIAIWRTLDDRNDDSIRPVKKVRGVRQRDVLNIPAYYVDQHWVRATNAYLAAIEVFNREGRAPDRRSAPSEAMLLTMAYLIDGTRSPTDLRRWFWHAVCDQRYAQGANTQVMADVLSPNAADFSASVPRDLVRDALTDEVRRSRVLRVGVRGLVAKHGGIDPLTRKPLIGPLRDFAVGPALRNQVLAPGSSAVADLVVCNETSLPGLRRLGRDGQLTRSINSEIIASQGFDPSSPIESEASRTSRASKILDWVEEEMQ